MIDIFKKFMKKKGSNGWTEIPNSLIAGNEWLSSKGITPQHRHILIAMISQDYYGSTLKISLKSLKSATGLGFDRILEALTYMESIGFIKRINPKHRCISEYSLEGFYEKFVQQESPPESEPTLTPKKYELTKEAKNALEKYGSNPPLVLQYLEPLV